ncbi:MAG: serine hydrolase [Proteobacteria bacterium]|nr:serine hydrolase [Pseudomonadota bacterium]
MPGTSADQFAPTEFCPWRKRVIQGEVHDENAYSVGGYSGHAGLFSRACDLFTLTEMLIGHYYGKRDDFLKPETVRTFFSRQKLVKDSTWALGWDTPSPCNSSAGDSFSRESVGHLGFTGTSVWIDLHRKILVIFLTNRVHPTRTNRKIREFRPALHNLIMNYFLLGKPNA